MLLSLLRRNYRVGSFSQLHSKSFGQVNVRANVGVILQGLIVYTDIETRNTQGVENTVKGIEGGDILYKIYIYNKHTHTP